MHWDSSVSIGNVLTVLAFLAGIFVAFNKFVSSHNSAVMSITAAVNNLSAICDRLQHSVEAQNTRLTSVENRLEIETEVQKRLAALKEIRP
jgi:uncharacterized protein YlxW (UPF0749 family)